jgi:hypothetical protein
MVGIAKCMVDGLGFGLSDLCLCVFCFEVAVGYGEVSPVKRGYGMLYSC